MRLRLKTILVFVALSLSLAASADEGLWLIQDLNAALEKKMRERGLKMPAKAVYDMESPGAGVADAVVSLGLRYSGSFVSDRGLMLTSGRPAIAFVSRIENVRDQLLSEGFWAVSEQHEIPVSGEKVYSLRRVYDVTEDFKTLIKRLGSKEAARLDVLKACEEAAKLPCFLTEYWDGEKAYVLAYKIYDDVRLVAVPPQGAVLPEGENGKWTWPSSRCDFSLYRVYENGRPALTRQSLVVSVDGYSKDSFSMVAGYPVETRRHTSFIEDLSLGQPSRELSSAMGEARLAILESKMAEDDGIKAKYSDRAAAMRDALSRIKSVSVARDSVSLMDRKKSADNQMQSAVDNDQALGGRWKGLLTRLEKDYDKVKDIELEKVLRKEALEEGSFIAKYILDASNASTPKKASEILLEGISVTDPEVEKELLSYSISEYFTNIDDYYFGTYQKWIQNRFGYDTDAAAAYLWDNSIISSPSTVSQMDSLKVLKNDPLLRFLSDSPLTLYDGRGGHQEDLLEADKARGEYLNALYWAGVRSGNPAYPDADSTLRLGFGSAEGSFTTPYSMLTDQTVGVPIGAGWKAAIGRDFWGRWGFKVNGKRHRMASNFLTGNDFVDGMEGAPVLDSQGRLIGVVSGGTAGSIVCEEAYVEGASGCVCTDIRFVLWSIERAAGLKKLVKEFVTE